MVVPLRNKSSTESSRSVPITVDIDSGAGDFATLVDPAAPIRPTPEPERSAGEMPVHRQGIEDWLVAEIASAQGVDPEQIDVNESFIANGLDSASSVALVSDLAQLLGVTLPETLTWDYPSIVALANHVAASPRARTTIDLSNGGG
jgi:acyl carrier protein